MTKSLFRQSFLTDTLDVHIDVAPAEQVLSNGVQLKLYQRGVLEVIPENPTQETKNIIISCGIHGDETAPMELVDSIIKDIESGFQKVDARCLFIIAHPESTLAHTRFLEENLNRLFDEKEHEPTKELAIADTLKLLVRDFYQDTEPKTRWHLDLHCAIRGSKHYTFAVSPKRATQFAAKRWWIFSIVRILKLCCYPIHHPVRSVGTVQRITVHKR